MLTTKPTHCCTSHARSLHSIEGQRQPLARADEPTVHYTHYTHLPLLW